MVNITTFKGTVTAFILFFILGILLVKAGMVLLVAQSLFGVVFFAIGIGTILSSFIILNEGLSFLKDTTNNSKYIFCFAEKETLLRGSPCFYILLTEYWLKYKNTDDEFRHIKNIPKGFTHVQGNLWKYQENKSIVNGTYELLSFGAVYNNIMDKFVNKDKV